MTATNSILLTSISDTEIGDDVERVAAAVGLRVISASNTPTRRAWAAATAVALDEAAARRCVLLGLPRRNSVVLLTRGEAGPSAWSVAIEVGAQHVYELPTQEGEWVRSLSEAADTASAGSGAGRVIAVFAGRGGAGASVFSAALASRVGAGLAVDLDPCGGGLDLLMGVEATPGLRWPDLVLQGGRLGWDAVRGALPRYHETAVLSGARRSFEIDPAPAEAVINAGRRGGVTVICDLPRRLTAAAERAVECADLVVAISTCDVRGAAATAALVPVVRAINPNMGLVVRGPSPGGLRPGEVADAAELPLLAAMRPEPMLAERLERGGLRLRRRSPLAATAQQVLAVLHRRSLDRAA